MWSTVTSLIVCDDYMLEDHNPYLIQSCSQNKNDSRKKLNDWILENSVNFNLVATQMCNVREHHHWRARLQLVSSCDLILNKCTR